MLLNELPDTKHHLSFLVLHKYLCQRSELLILPMVAVNVTQCSVHLAEHIVVSIVVGKLPPCCLVGDSNGCGGLNKGRHKRTEYLTSLLLLFLIHPKRGELVGYLFESILKRK